MVLGYRFVFDEGVEFCFVFWVVGLGRLYYLGFFIVFGFWLGLLMGSISRKLGNGRKERVWYLFF